MATVRLDRVHTLTFCAAHLLPPYPYPAHTWRIEIRRLRGILATAATGTNPVILAGDLNATLDNEPVRDLLSAGYTDAAEHAGAGYDATYPTDRWIPLSSLSTMSSAVRRPRPTPEPSRCRDQTTARS